MEIVFTKQASEDLMFWKKSGDIRIQKRIQILLTSIAAHPFEGIGKPEPLKHILSGKWSRRITKEHRIVYAVTDDRVIVLQLRFHY